MSLLEELKRHIADGDVVVIAGTGVSIQATNNARCAAWLGLIEDGLEYAVELGRLSERDAANTKRSLKRRAKDLDFLLSTAHDLTAKLGPNFNGWLQKRISALQAVHREVIELLPRLGALVATTNYDHVISDVTGLPPVPWTNHAAVDDVVRGRKRGVLHLHGSYDAPDSVIFDILSYKRLEESEHAQAILTTLRTARTLLFIGCGDGLRDPHFAAFLRWTEKAFEKSSYSHFILCRKSEVAAIRKAHLPERHLEPISYGKDFSELPEFLRSLLPVVADPLPPPPPRPRVLPDPGPCFGRDSEVRAVTDALLGAPAARLAILGIGGLGKTTLTLKALHDPRVQQRFGERIYFVRCDGATNVDGVLTAIAGDMRITGTPQIREAILGALAAGPAVLVLDNFETPWQFATLDVEELLTQISGLDTLHLVVTMRGKERPAGVSWRDPIEPPLLSLSAARDAFLAVAGSRFRDDPHLDELLDAMDRLPLGITLMAYVAQSEAHLSVLLERWRKKRTAILQRAGGKGKATNIEVSFDLSIDSPRVTPHARRLLSMLAMLPGGMAHQDIPTLLDDGYEAAAVLRGSGLAFDEGERLRMLAPLRVYVSDRYPASADDESTVLDHYMKLSALGFKIGGPVGDEVVKRLSAEVANIEWALVRATEGTPFSPMLEYAADGFGTLILCNGSGSLAPLRRAAEAAERVGDWSLQASMMDNLARIAILRGEPRVAEEQLQALRSLHEEHGNGFGLASATALLGDVAMMLGEMESAATRYGDALALFRKESSLSGQANCLRALGDIAFDREQWDEARRFYEEALPAIRQSNSMRDEAICMRMMGDILLRQKDFDGAHRQYDQALSLSRTAGDVQVEANCHISFGDLFSQLSHLERAAESYRQALELFVRVGDRFSIGLANHRLARITHNEDERRRHVEAARAAWRPIRPQWVKELDEDFPDL